ncbi:MAG TPA: hypothetical protein VFO06_07090 [Gemmatimonadales bacterium]|nr:hypothetical protein [Gemmatimonadales bacterium]
MVSIRKAPLIGCLVFLAAAPAAGQVGIAPEDGLRVAEAIRLAEQIQERVWPGWSAAPFELLLVTADHEFLFGAKVPPSGWTPADSVARLSGRVWQRPRVFSPAFLATFPAFGRSPVIIIGRAEATEKTSTAWVLTVMHEHFHQLQMSRPGYFDAVNALDLSRGDTSGMWMLNYAFPYDSVPVARAMAALALELADAVEQPSAARREAFWRDYRHFLDSLGETDRRYLRLQLWQEGVARYVELRAAEIAAREFVPSREFSALQDYEAFGILAQRLRDGILSELRAANLPVQRRVLFYPFGAGLALLLDQSGARWNSAYFDWTFLAGAGSSGP